MKFIESWGHFYCHFEGNDVILQAKYEYGRENDKGSTAERRTCNAGVQDG